MKKRPARAKRVRAKRSRRVHRERTRPGRVRRIIFPHEYTGVRGLMMELRLARDRRRMLEAIDSLDGKEAAAAMERDRAQGCVRSWTYRLGQLRRRPLTVERRRVARMYLNRKDIQRIGPAEMISHECGHAAMVVARHRGADLSTTAGEETMMLVLGWLVAEIAYWCRIEGAA